jgi:hypothetical protein
MLPDGVAAVAGGGAAPVVAPDEVLFAFEPYVLSGAAELVAALLAGLLLLLSAAQPVQKTATASKASRAIVLRIIFSPIDKKGFRSLDDVRGRLTNQCFCGERSRLSSGALLKGRDDSGSLR